MTQEGTTAREWMFQLLRTRMAFRRAMQRNLKRREAGITFEMLQVLSSLWDEQGISQQVLAERTAKGKACLTNLMNNLEKKGYVRREEDPADRRNKLVFLTPAGEALHEQIHPIIFEVYARMERELGRDFIHKNLMELGQLYEMLENV